jgi:hypothetical protein
MTIKYEDVDESVIETFLEVAEENFETIGQLKLKFVFNTKKAVKNGKIRLGTCELASDKIRYFSKDDIAVEGYDYVITLDKKAWQFSDKDMKKRLMRHELRHILIDEKGKLKIAPHDVEDFRIEMKLNQDDPDWGHKLATITEAAYDQEKEQAKQLKKEEK